MKYDSRIYILTKTADDMGKLSDLDFRDFGEVHKPLSTLPETIQMNLREFVMEGGHYSASPTDLCEAVMLIAKRLPGEAMVLADTVDDAGASAHVFCLGGEVIFRSFGGANPDARCTQKASIKAPLTWLERLAEYTLADQDRTFIASLTPEVQKAPAKDESTVYVPETMDTLDFLTAIDIVSEHPQLREEKQVCRRLSIPRSLRVIVPGAIEHLFCMSRLEEIVLDPENPNFTLRDGRLYSSDGTQIYPENAKPDTAEEEDGDVSTFCEVDFNKVGGMDTLVQAFGGLNDRPTIVSTLDTHYDKHGLKHIDDPQFFASNFTIDLANEWVNLIDAHLKTLEVMKKVVGQELTKKPEAGTLAGFSALMKRELEDIAKIRVMYWTEAERVVKAGLYKKIRDEDLRRGISDFFCQRLEEDEEDITINGENRLAVPIPGIGRIREAVQYRG